MISLTLPGIYKIENVSTAHVYVGSAVNIDRRWRRHKSELNCCTHTNQKLQRAWNKYGFGAFAFSVLETVADKCDLLVREQHWIDVLDACGSRGYNILERAGSHLGAKRSEATRAKLREVNRGRSPDAAAIEKMRAAKLGRKLSEAHKAKIAAGNVGKKMSAECIEKRIAIAALNPGASGYTGVTWCAPMNKWRARVKRGGVECTVGYFDAPKDAYTARQAFIEGLNK